MEEMVCCFVVGMLDYIQERIHVMGSMDSVQDIFTPSQFEEYNTFSCSCLCLDCLASLGTYVDIPANIKLRQFNTVGWT